MFQDYIDTHPETIILDPLPAIRTLLDRCKSYQLIHRLESCMKGVTPLQRGCVSFKGFCLYSIMKEVFILCLLPQLLSIGKEHLNNIRAPSPSLELLYTMLPGRCLTLAGRAAPQQHNRNTFLLSAEAAMSLTVSQSKSRPCLRASVATPFSDTGSESVGGGWSEADELRDESSLHTINTLVTHLHSPAPPS